ncbi:MAG TPA: xanthine dehydrogenase family protein molybdopterin-binding subunit [Candidatus Aminicenantes bacterium]|nr:xanthine dehydrogenase family protein molybdopterin-binding subunit [Candidatus Aminicenantes bacterium]
MRKKEYFADSEEASLLYREEFRDMKTEEPEVAPSPEKDKFEIIGKSTSRIDGEKIVTGRAPYTHDIKLRGMLYGKILRSPHACAEVISMDISQVQSLPGVKAAIQLKKGRVTYAGEQVAAVAAVDEKTAEQALKLIKVEYKSLPFAVTEEKAMEEGAPQVRKRPNVQKFNEYTRGNIDKGFKEADFVLENTYKTAVEIHHPAETHGSVAKWEGERLTVWDSTQAIFGVRDGLARALKIPASRIKVIKHYMGGGFGSKLGINDYTVAAAMLAKQANKPVKIILSRRENSLCVGNRPSSLQTIKGGVKKDGTLTALYLKNYTSGGIGRGDYCSEPVVDLYKCPNVQVEEHSVFTNTGASRPTRAPGHVQGTFALEGFLEELANKINLDPLELRKKNYSTKNQGDKETPYSSKGLNKCYQLGAEKIGWKRRNKRPGEGNGKVRRGLGVASQIWWGVGRAGTQADVKLHPDGSVEAICGTQDIGCGTRTYMATITAETLGLRPKDVTVKIGNTEYPWCGGSGGSTTTPSVAPAIRDAALKAADYLKKMAAEKLKAKPDEINITKGKFSNKNDPVQSIGYKKLIEELRKERKFRREKVFHGEYVGRPSGFAYNTFGAHFAEVEVDVETGKVKVLKVVGVHEIGRLINKITAESQIIGGITQGVSTALFEERIMDNTTGNVANPNFRDYKIATSLDIPEITPLIVDTVDPRINNLGAKGLGEPPRIPPAGAIANAVYNAIGVHVREIPMTPDKVLQALKRKEVD